MSDISNQVLFIYATGKKFGAVATTSDVQTKKKELLFLATIQMGIYILPVYVLSPLKIDQKRQPAINYMKFVMFKKGVKIFKPLL